MLKILAEVWSIFVETLSTQGGGLLLLTVILAGLIPLLYKDNAEGWKAAMFILGAITGIINNNLRSKTVENNENKTVIQATNSDVKTEVKE